MALHQINAGLTPDQRIEALMRDFFAPPPASDFEYETTLRDVAIAMADLEVLEAA
jgi:hypothetical protein